MSEIDHIIDMDGFTVDGGKTFLCKEMALINVCDGWHELVTFRLNRNFHSLSDADKKSVWYVKNFVHGIPFKDFGCEKYDQIEIFNVIKNFTRDFANPMIAYKGGCFERDILRQMKIRYINLETIGCPKYDILINDPTHKIPHIPCPLHCWVPHKKNVKTKPYHCSLNEVRTFRSWLNNTKFLNTGKISKR